MAGETHGKESEVQQTKNKFYLFMCCSQYSLPLTSSSSTVVFESEDSLTWDSSPFLAIIDLPGRWGVCCRGGIEREKERQSIDTRARRDTLLGNRTWLGSGGGGNNKYKYLKVGEDKTVIFVTAAATLSKCVAGCLFLITSKTITAC